MTQLERLKISFQLWLQNYMGLNWKKLNDQEIRVLLDFHFEEFLKELRLHTKENDYLFKDE